MSNTKPATTAMLTVYDGQQEIGFVLRRGPVGVEAFTASDDSLGMFRNECDAASAIWRATREVRRSIKGMCHDCARSLRCHAVARQLPQ
jgi:hypothetical protein